MWKISLSYIVLDDFPKISAEQEIPLFQYSSRVQTGPYHTNIMRPRHRTFMIIETHTVTHVFSDETDCRPLCGKSTLTICHVNICIVRQTKPDAHHKTSTENDEPSLNIYVECRVVRAGFSVLVRKPLCFRTPSAVLIMEAF